MAETLPLVVSIQSQVAYGHVGNGAAALTMRACGVEVVEVPTTLLSNHPRYPTTRGRLLEPDLVAELLAGLVERGVHERAALVLSGFLGRSAVADAVAGFVATARAAHPAVIYACDPVMGDADIGFFAEPALRRAFAERLVPVADVVLPNAFELGALTGMPVLGPEDVALAQAALGRPSVVATSVPVAGAPERIATVVATDESVSAFEVARLQVRPAGTGDLLAGLVAARLAQGVPLGSAVARAVAGVRAALERTGEGPWAEMPLAASLPVIVAAGAARDGQAGTAASR